MKLLRYFYVTIVAVFALIGVIFTGVFFAMQFGLLHVRGSIAERNGFFGTATLPSAGTVPACRDTAKSKCLWSTTPEWEVIQVGLTKDQAIIKDVSVKTGVPMRLIAAAAVPEQIRFFTAEREVFKRYFEPLKILGSLSQFSLGVSGIKQETANKIELYAASTTSPFYPGGGSSGLIVYEGGEAHDSALYNRLTDPKNHYYSYLYTALFIKEIEAQWAQAGFDISNNPGAIVTLFNVGFSASHPNSAPRVAGSIITTGGVDYAYGELGGDFYASGELTDIFPK